MEALSGHGQRVVAALVHLVVPEFPALEPATRRSVEDEVGRYVASQIAGMPGYLALPYRLALRIFDGLPRLFYLQPFVRLDAARGTRYLERWSNAPLAPMRDFVKLVRSCALLAYFDHPAVVAQLQSGTAVGSGR